MSIALRIESVSKLYRLGAIGTGTISHDLNRWWHRVRGKEDPYQKVGQRNVREGENGQGTEYVWALKDIDVQVQKGEILGVIGRNGAGKSTLLKLLSRVTAPTTGVICTKGRIASLLEVGTGFHPELTGRENVFLNGAILGMTKREIAKELDAIVDFSGCEKYLDTPVKRYSSGMMVRLGFSVAAHLQCETLIVDEVLAVGDFDFQKRCIGKMSDAAKSGRTVLFVSHNMPAVQKLCHRGLLLSQGTVEMEGPLPEVIAAYMAGNTELVAGKEVHIHRSGLGEQLILKSALLKNASEMSTNAILCGEDCAFEVEFETEIAIDDVSVLFSVNDEGGNRLAQLCNTYRGQQLSLPAGRTKIRCEVPKFPFSPNTLRIDLKLLSKNEILFAVEDAFKICVETGDYFNSGKMADPQWAGIIQIQHDWVETSL